MTLDEMIKKEQENAQNNQKEAQMTNNSQNISHGSEDNSSSGQSTQNIGSKQVTTIASSNDEKVDRSQFSLKTKSFTPVVLPEDFYTVKLVGIDKKEAKAWDSEELQPNFIWKFEVISDSDGKQLQEKVTISKWCKAFSKGENSNNYKYYMALMQETPEDGYNILDAIGKYARAYITQKSWTDSKTGVKMTKSVIEKLLPVKK